jgi:hypothetical protein
VAIREAGADSRSVGVRGRGTCRQGIIGAGAGGGGGALAKLPRLVGVSGRPCKMTPALSVAFGSRSSVPRSEFA